MFLTHQHHVFHQSNPVIQPKRHFSLPDPAKSNDFHLFKTISRQQELIPDSQKPETAKRSTHVWVTRPIVHLAKTLQTFLLVFKSSTVNMLII